MMESEMKWLWYTLKSPKVVVILKKHKIKEDTLIFKEWSLVA